MGNYEAAEWQFDGLVGPTHSYAGLSFGNIASHTNAGQPSNPKRAALQGLEKMRLVHGLGIPQAFLPPHKRPIIPVLQRLGYGTGNSKASIAYTIDSTYKNAPHLLAAAYSSAFMWAANAATVSPSADTDDGKLHLTPANLVSHLHRSVEAAWNNCIFKKIFHNETLFTVHNSLHATNALADEGAANCMRISDQHAHSGIEVYVYGSSETTVKKPIKYPARQKYAAGDAISFMHRLKKDKTIYVKQLANTIDQGVFHNDVIAMNTVWLMIAHERAYAHQKKFISELERYDIAGFKYIAVTEKEFSVAEAVSTYLFNSQLIETPQGMVLLAPSECEHDKNAQRLLQRLVQQEKVVNRVHYLNVRESMRNGGGPACLRLRIVMTPEESAAMHQGIIYNEKTHQALHQWVSKHYRDRLTFTDLRDPLLIDELEVAYSELETLIGMPGLYSHGF